MPNTEQLPYQTDKSSHQTCSVKNKLFSKIFAIFTGKHLWWSLFFINQPDSVILQKCQSLSDQSFKHNSVHMRSLSLTLTLFLNLGVVCSSLTVTKKK